MRRFAFILLVWALSLLAADRAGAYKGTYSGGGSGDIHLTLAQGEGNNWKATASFTYSGEEVKCNVTSATVEGDVLHVTYTFELGGNQLQSVLTGEWKADALEGAYKTTATADGTPVDEGTFKMTAER